RPFPDAMLSRVRKARKCAADVRNALKTSRPEELEQALPPLAEAIACLREVESAIASGEATTPELRAELALLREDLERIENLLNHGMAIQGGLMRILAAALGGYTESGEPSPVKTAGDVSISG